MIDFQDGGLEHQVYELIAKMCTLACSDNFPHFETKLLEDGEWQCKLAIPGVKKASIGHGKTEVDSINICALGMLDILKREHDKDQYDPDIEENIFGDNISQFFNVEFDKEYRYRLCETDILLDVNDEYAYRLLQNYASSTINDIKTDGEEIDCMSDIVTIRFLVKERKKNYC